MTAACDERRRLAADRGTRKKIQVIPYSLDLRILWGARRRRLASMVFYCRTARGAAAAIAPQGSFLSLANTHPALREGLVYELPQHTLVLARLPSVAHILKKSRVILMSTRTSSMRRVIVPARSTRRSWRASTPASRPSLCSTRTTRTCRRSRRRCPTSGCSTNPVWKANFRRPTPSTRT